MNKNTDLGLLILRVSAGVMMLLHGIAKFKGLGGIEGMLEAKNLPTFIAYGVYVGEVLAPIMMIVGFRTRIAAVIFAGNLVVAYWLAHSGQMFQLNDHGAWAIELIGLYFFAAVTLFFTGGGRLGVSSSNKWD